MDVIFEPVENSGDEAPLPIVQVFSETSEAGVLGIYETRVQKRIEGALERLAFSSGPA